MQTSSRRQRPAAAPLSALRLTYEVREIMTGRLVARSHSWQSNEGEPLKPLIHALRSLYPIAAGYQHIAREV